MAHAHSTALNEMLKRCVLEPSQLGVSCVVRSIPKDRSVGRLADIPKTTAELEAAGFTRVAAKRFIHPQASIRTGRALPAHRCYHWLC